MSDLSQIGIIEFQPDLVADCLKQIDAAIQTHQISVLLGFSQGGNVVDTYLRTTTIPLQHQDMIQKEVIFSGYSLVYPMMIKVTVPLLSIYSDEDEVIKSQYRSVNYETIQEITHTKGHRFPTQKPVYGVIVKCYLQVCLNK